MTPMPCHKTIEWWDDEDGLPECVISGKTVSCAGAEEFRQKSG